VASPNPFDGAREIQGLLVSYAKQETIAPLKQLGRYLGFGVVGALLLFLGSFFVGLGVLRLMQTFEVFGGSSWASTVPYIIAIVALVIILIVMAQFLSRAKKRVR